MIVKNLSCFSTDHPQSGNPATVILNFTGNAAEMQQYAKESHTAACAFVLPDQVVRFFYPEMESELCIHAALCAAKVLLDKSNQKTIHLKTKSGNILYFQKEDAIYQIKTCIEPCTKEVFAQNLLSHLLNTEDFAESLPCQLASIGSPKLLVPLFSEQALAQLSPNLEAIKDWSIKQNINGIYAYAQLSENIFAARNFNPKTGLTEDIATGVSAGALASSLGRSIKIFQGQYLGHPSCIEVNYEASDTIWVGGKIREQ
ncbi:MAG: PhzF family phenazine biosynthesis protein [Gammaproteobacteria bacterium]|jgi:PhzF family phenazine biosynthesis protein|nr:PhzF family phenazine biosynthesis protein [Gammaproteobacteria bacterium]